MSSTTLAAPLLLALQREILERGAWPLLRVGLPGQAEGFWNAVRDEQLDAFPSAELAAARELDASLRIQATENANALAGVDPARLARAARAQSPLREARLAQALGDHAVADGRRRPAGRDGHGRASRRSSSARCSSTATTRSPPGASCATSRPG